MVNITNKYVDDIMLFSCIPLVREYVALFFRKSLLNRPIRVSLDEAVVIRASIQSANLLIEKYPLTAQS